MAGAAVMQNETERRGFQRLTPARSVFVAFRPDFETLGKVRDISTGGLSCEYLLFERDAASIVVFQVDIFLPEGDFYMSKVPCRMVYESRAGRCGLEFGILSVAQKYRLDLICGSCGS